MDDLVSRQLAIATAISGRVRTQDGEDWIRVSEVRESLYAVPSIDAVKHGRWIRTTKADYAWECSACGYGLCDNRTTYCYDCGARMDGEENG